MFLTFWAKIIRVTHFFAVILPFCVVNRFATNKKTTLAIPARAAKINHQHKLKYEN